MSHYDIISDREYRYAKIHKDQEQAYIPGDLKQVIDFLLNENGHTLEGVYLENPKFPEIVVVINGRLPIDLIRSRFSDSPQVTLSARSVVGEITPSSLIGSTLD